MNNPNECSNTQNFTWSFDTSLDYVFCGKRAVVLIVISVKVLSSCGLSYNIGLCLIWHIVPCVCIVSFWLNWSVSRLLLDQHTLCSTGKWQCALLMVFLHDRNQYTVNWRDISPYSKGESWCMCVHAGMIRVCLYCVPPQDCRGTLLPQGGVVLEAQLNADSTLYRPLDITVTH